MVKWRLRLDSARQIGLETALKNILIAVESVIAGAELIQLAALSIRESATILFPEGGIKQVSIPDFGRDLIWKVEIPRIL
jgi:hypothetical protein